MKKIKKLLSELFRNIKNSLWISNINKELTYDEAKKIENKVITININRTIILSIFFFILQVGYIISDLCKNFYAEEPLSCLNLAAEVLGVAGSLIIGISLLVLSDKEKSNSKLLEKITISYYWVIAICFTLYLFSDFYRGVFSSTVFFIAIIFGLIPFFRKPMAVSFLIYFAAVTVIASFTSPNRNPENDVFVSLVVYLASFLMSFYLKHNFIRSLIDNIKMEKLNKELEEISGIDFLTEIANRRGLEKYIDNNIEEWVNENKAIGIICIDIDFFKLYNDEYNHHEGDECLKKITKVLMSKATEYDGIAARVGGEEMNILINDVSSEEALVYICEEIRKEILNLKIEHASKTNRPYVSISIGGSYFKVTSKNDLQKEIDKTDILLYNAKSNGRNKTSVNGKLYGGSYDVEE